jgi:hypothetical protein
MAYRRKFTLLSFLLFAAKIIDNPTSLTDSAKKRKCFLKKQSNYTTLDNTSIPSYQCLTDFKANKKIKTHDIDEDRMYLN